jgi:hypothetical protein
MPQYVLDAAGRAVQKQYGLSDEEYEEWGGWTVLSSEEIDRCIDTVLAQRRAKHRPHKDRKAAPPKRLRPQCGARTRAGPPCKARAVWDHENNRPRNGRCRMHGGLNTGPSTPEGKARQRAAVTRGAVTRQLRAVDRLLALGQVDKASAQLDRVFATAAKASALTAACPPRVDPEPDAL